VLAAQALSHAIRSGDRTLALAAVRVLEKAGPLAPDASLLLLIEAVRGGQWSAASLHIDRIEEDEVFAFMAPILRAWVAQGSRKGDPIDILAHLDGKSLASTYADEQRPLLLLARGDRKEGLSVLATLLPEAGARAPRLRIAAASLLARKGERKQALALLEGEAAPLVAARARVAARKPLAGEVVGVSEGIGQFLVRIAGDLAAQEVPQLALSFARLATFASPGDSEAWLLTASLLSTEGLHQPALAALARVRPDDPFAGAAADSRIAILSRDGHREEALADARAAASASPALVESWTRLGDLLSQMQRHGDAAEAYGRALALAKEGTPSGTGEWALWLLHGSALSQAGQWAAGKAALEEARRLAPDQAVVLNYLGYSQLERRENLGEAERLIRQASELQPDDPAITDSLGWAHYVRGDLAGAIGLLERAAEGQPADPAINEHLGDAYYSAGRRYEARYAWRAALVYAEGDAANRLRAKLEAGLKPEFAAP
jgi:tetratricopeptide (TPR) repeat protein